MKSREPSFLRQIIAIHYEQAKRRKAIRQLAKAEWSFEFLCEVVRKSAQMLKKDIVIEVETESGRKIRISSIKDYSESLNADGDIFNKLDDEAAVQRFIKRYGK